MSSVAEAVATTDLDRNEGASRWASLADRVLDGHVLTVDEGMAILESSDDELLDLLAAAYRIRRQTFGNTVQLYYLMNAKSGLCPEDCGYCSQSKVSEAAIPRYNLLQPETLLEGARRAAANQAKTYCIVISARGPSEREIAAVEEIVPRIKAETGLDICACLGLLTDDQARRLAQCGVDRVNHNLNTSERHYGDICTTHTYQDRVRTLAAVKSAGLEMCSGGIIGMGENHRDLVEMALELRRIGVVSIPVNFHVAIDGTPLANTTPPSPRDCLRGLALFRFANPTTELRIAGGREVHLRSLQPLGLYPANSIFVGDYLTTKGQEPSADFKMLEDMGFVVTHA